MSILLSSSAGVQTIGADDSVMEYASFSFSFRGVLDVTLRIVEAFVASCLDIGALNVFVVDVTGFG